MRELKTKTKQNRDSRVLLQINRIRISGVGNQECAFFYKEDVRCISKFGNYFPNLIIPGC